MTNAVDPRPTKYIHVGEFFASNQPTIVRTLLGSCVAVCLFDPRMKVGGMNHFLLPRTMNGCKDTGRFGETSIRALVERMREMGSTGRNLRIQLFGGAHVLPHVKDGPSTAGRMNVAFVMELLRTGEYVRGEQDLGDRVARRIRFETDTGMAHVTRLPVKIGTRALPLP